MVANRLTGIWITERESRARDAIAEFDLGYECGFEDASAIRGDGRLVVVLLAVTSIVGFLVGLWF